VIDAGVPCETHVRKFKAKITSYEKELAQIPRPALDLSGRHDFVDYLKPDGSDNWAQPRTSAPLESPLTTLRKQLDDRKAQRSAYEQARAFNTAQEAEEGRLRAELEQIQTDPQAEQAIVDLKDRIARGEGVLVSAMAHQTGSQAYQKAIDVQKALGVEVERLEALVEQLGPKGLRVDALAAKLGPFTEAVYAGTAPFGWIVKFELDPWVVTANGRPVETYSQSEQFRIGIAIQLAIAQMSGLSFAVVDALDQLDAENRKIVGSMLFQCPLEQVVILATRENSVPLPKGEGTIAYRLSNVEGRSQITERVPQ
jgi:DNA repair exonuclease SbcCD ATPase subunit